MSNFTFFCFVDTHLPNATLFYTHLVACGPVEDVPLNWTSDDSEIEQMMSAAENLLSVHAPCVNETTSFERQQTTEPVLFEGASEEPQSVKLPVAESSFDDSALSESTEDSDLPVVRLSFCDLVPQEFSGGTVYKVSSQALDSLLRHFSEPASSAAGSGEPEKLKHQASAPANLQSYTTYDDNVPMMSEAPAERQMSVSASQQQEAASENVKSNDSFHKIHDVPEIRMSDSLLAAEIPHQSSVVLASSNTGNNTGYASHVTSVNPNQAGREVIFSSATNSGLPSESLFPPASWSPVTQQCPAAFHGARPKVPPTVVLETSPIPIFVQEETLSEDETEEADLNAAKYGDTSSAVVTFLPVTSSDRNGLVSNIMSQFSALVMTNCSTSDQPMVSDVGLFAELDLRNNEELVSIYIKYYY